MGIRAQVGDHSWRVPLKTLASLTTWALLSLWGQMNVVIVLRRCRLQQHLPSPNYWKPSTLASVLWVLAHPSQTVTCVSIAKQLGVLCQARAGETLTRRSLSGPMFAGSVLFCTRPLSVLVYPGSFVVTLGSQSPFERVHLLVATSSSLTQCGELRLRISKTLSQIPALRLL